MKKQDGFGIILILVAIVIIAMLAGGAYLYLAKQGKAPTPTSGPLSKLTNAITLNPNCSFHDPNLCKFLNNWKTQTAYSVQGSTTNSDGTKSDLKIDINGNDQSHTVITTNSKENFNIIVIGNTTYTKDYTDNKWWKQQNSQDTPNYKDEFTFTDNQATDSASPDKTTYKALGQEACGKLTCYKYQFIDPSSTDSSQYLWFDTNQYLLRQIETKSADQDAILAYSYDKVSITAPTNTKEMPSPTAVPDINSADYQQQLQQAQQYLQSHSQQ